MSEALSRTDTHLVRVEYNPEPRFLSETYGLLSPGPDGEQTLFVHAHLAQEGALPWIDSIIDAETGDHVRVSGSWLGGRSEAALQRRERDRFITAERSINLATAKRLLLFSSIAIVSLTLGVVFVALSLASSSRIDLDISIPFLFGGGALAVILAIAFHQDKSV